MTIKEFQKTLPWDRPSHDDQRLHAALHIMKAAGKIAAAFEAEGHGGRFSEPGLDALPKYLADLLICSARLAGQQGFCLETATIDRMKSKNPSYMPPRG